MPTRRARKSRRRLHLLTGCLVLIAGVVGYCLFDQSRSRAALAEVHRRLARREYTYAQPLLAWLASRRPSDGEAQFQLGLCEWELGHDEAARKAWDSVPSGSPFAGRAAVQRARQELRHDRFADAEVLMTRALGDRGAHATEALETLVHLFKIQGRFREARRLVRSSWDRYPDAIGVLKELAQIDSFNPYPPVKARQILERAARAAPDDDRVWLGFANLAIRANEFAESERWLRCCEERRRRDQAVGRARLSLALAAADTAAALRVLRGLSSDTLDPDEVLRLRAWFAEQSGEAEAERRALSDLLDLAPDDPRAMDRLSELELRSGSGDRASRLRVRKAEFDRAKAEYDEVLFLPDASSQATRLALLAETLRRSLEARILWNLVRAQRPQDPRATQGLARIESIVLLAVPASATLPALLAEVELVRAATPGTSRAKAPDETWTCPVFTDDAEAAGLKFTFDNGLEPLHHLPETTSGGVALLDYDGDGWLDVYVVQGGPFPPAPSAAGGDRLYRNRGDGTFEDVTTTSRIGALARGYGHGVTVGDYDNDGRPDLFVTRWRRYALFHNRGDGTFEDVTETADLAGDRDFPTSAAFADLDGDGDLDLYVCHYGAWDTEHPALCPRSGRDGYEYCDPRTIPPLSDHLFRNDAGRFVEVTSEAGIVDPDGRGLGVVAADFDEDGKVDLYVANDTTANFLFHNLGGMRFDEIGHLAGVASNAKGGYQASMGIACGDLDGDGRLDIAVGNFLNESMTFYHNLGQCLFSDATAAIGLESHTRNSLSFGTAFLDANADGYLDLAVANGHVNDLRPEAPWRMPAQLFLGGPGSRLIDVSGRAGEPWQVPRLGRGLAIGDLDNDGRVDLLILSQNEPLAFFHNRTAGGHALALRLEGVSSNRDAVGARVIVEANGVRRVGYRFGGGSFQSASDPRFHFGIGPARMVDRVEVHWPSGKIDRFENLPSDAIYLVREGDNNPRKLACFRTSEAPSSSRP